jgi:phytoene/squalene synthetase
MTLAACAEIVRKGDPDRFLASMAAPPHARARLLPLYAFNLEVARAPWLTKEAIIAEMRLQWWRDAVDEIAAGKPARAHEVCGPLAEVIRAADLPSGPLGALIDARLWDIHREPFADAAAFSAHLEATGGGLMWLAVKALGGSPGMEGAARSAGWALGLANWLRAIPELEARGRLPLVDGRPEAIAALASEGLERLETAHKHRFGAALPALWSAWQAGPVLKQAARAPGRVAQGALGLSEFRRRGRLLRLSLSGRW